MKCVESGRLQVRELARLPERVTARSVLTESGEANVSLADGYRAILDTSNGVPFVNLKIERSDMGSFDADRAAIRAQMERFSRQRASGARALAMSSRDGVEILELHQPNLDKGGPLSFYSLFVPRESIVATAYVLNQDPQVRAFRTMTDYETMRQDFIASLVDCLQKHAI